MYSRFTLFAACSAVIFLGQGCPTPSPAANTDVSEAESARMDLPALGAPVEPEDSADAEMAVEERPQLLDYEKAAFEAALASDKLIVLYFYANWCPICRAEFPKMQQAFEELSGGDVIGFRVSFNDNETMPEEEALAREHGVAYQHTKVFIKNGARILKSPEGWEKGRYLEEIAKYR